MAKKQRKPNPDAVAEEAEAAEQVQPPETVDRAIIGRTSATERQPTTSDDFSFWLGPDVLVNPFDIVEVDQAVPPSKTYGLVTTIDHYTDAGSHLSNFVTLQRSEVVLGSGSGGSSPVVR